MSTTSTTTSSSSSSTTTTLFWDAFVFLDTIQLPDLIIQDEFGEQLVDSMFERSLNGNFVINEMEIPSGRNLDLAGGNDFGWVTRLQLSQLQSLASVPNVTYTLRFGLQREWTVRFRHEDSPAISADPLVPRFEHENTDYYNNVQIKLMVI